MNCKHTDAGVCGKCVPASSQPQPPHDVLTAFRRMPSAADLTALLSQLCIERELKLLQSRWEIAKLLHMGFSYNTIKRKTGASSATISRTRKMMGTKEFDLALRLYFEAVSPAKE